MRFKIKAFRDQLHEIYDAAAEFDPKLRERLVNLLASMDEQDSAREEVYTQTVCDLAQLLAKTLDSMRELASTIKQLAKPAYNMACVFNAPKA